MGRTYALVIVCRHRGDHRPVVVRPRLLALSRIPHRCTYSTGSSSAATSCGSSCDGLRRSTKASTSVEGYFLANRSLPWWAVGLSVMATQLSAITLVGTTGQGYADGMRFIQFYFGLPIAMIILSVTLVPFFYRARVYTAYEYLERRFDVKTRTLASILFLCSRGACRCGVIVAAPAVILSIMLGWNLTLTILAIGAADGRSTRWSAASRRSRGPTSSRWRSSSRGLFARRRRADPRPAARRQRRPGAARGRRRGPPQPDRLPLRLRSRPTRSGRA